MTEIIYSVGGEMGMISWAAAEEFAELAGKRFSLGRMEAKQIDQMGDLSPVAKLLLSAVAGATIQHLLDKGIPAEKIFAEGTFKVK